MAAGADLPHDLYTFVIERALGITYGFWGCVAEGATFRSFRRKRTPQGKAVIDRHTADLRAAEERVNELYFAWRAGAPTVVDADLDAMLERWRALADGTALVVEWSSSRATTRRSSSAANSRRPTSRRRVRTAR